MERVNPAAVYINRSDCDRCNVAIRFGLSTQTPQDRTVFTVRIYFNSHEGLGYLHLKGDSGCS